MDSRPGLQFGLRAWKREKRQWSWTPDQTLSIKNLHKKIVLNLNQHIKWTPFIPVQVDPLEADVVHDGQTGQCERWRLHQRIYCSTQKPDVETSHDRYSALEHQQQHRWYRWGKPLTFIHIRLWFIYCPTGFYFFFCLFRLGQKVSPCGDDKTHTMENQFSLSTLQLLPVCSPVWLNEYGLKFRGSSGWRFGPVVSSPISAGAGGDQIKRRCNTPGEEACGWRTNGSYQPGLGWVQQREMPISPFFYVYFTHTITVFSGL